MAKAFAQTRLAWTGAHPSPN